MINNRRQSQSSKKDGGTRKITLTSVVSFLSGLLGIIGASGWCCTVAGAAVFSFLGLASISSYLVYYNKWLFIFSIIFLVLAIIHYINYKKNKSCKITSATLQKNKGRRGKKNKYVKKN